MYLIPDQMEPYVKGSPKPGENDAKFVAIIYALIALIFGFLFLSIQ
jgi:hypothetical protein